MSNGFLRFLIGGIILILLAAGSVLVYDYFINDDTSSNTPYTRSEKNDIQDAINSGNPSLYQNYLKDGKKMSFAFDDGTTPLEKLIEGSDIMNAQELIKNGFDLTIVENNHIDTISNIVVYNKNFEFSSVDLITIELINQVKDEIDKKDTSGYSLLMNSIYANNVNITKEVIKYSSNINGVYNNETALTFACEQGVDNLEIIKELISKGADVNQKGSEGYTCLMYAVYNNQNTIVDYLVTLEDLNVNLRNDFGQTALHLCVEYSNIEAIDILLQSKNPDKTIEDNDGYTAKQYAQILGKNNYVLKLE